MKKYSWKNKTFSTNPQIAGKELERITKKYKKHGKLENQHIVDESRDKNSILHPEFEWRDKIAGEKYRCVQAGQIVRSIYVVNITEEVKEPIRAFVNITNNTRRKTEDSGYISIETAMGDIQLRDRIVQQAKLELQQWRERYEGYKRLAKIFAFLDKELAN